MLQSTLFTKTKRAAPKDEISINASFLARGGYIHKEMAGVYTLLPLGVRVLNNINAIIRKRMDEIGGQEVFLTVLQDSSIWEKTERWSDDAVDTWFKSELKNGGKVGLGFTHEEPLTRIMSEHISSYRDIPVLVYQIQTKFRNELRAKSGIMRGREFLMKDMYSFARNKEEHMVLYEKITEAYWSIFRDIGIDAYTYKTFASGGSFSKYSHEFQVLLPSGEDTIYVDEKTKIAVNKEVFSPEVLQELGISEESLIEKKASEVGNIFTLGTRFSEPLGLTYKDEAGKEIPVFMGSYGIGATRLMGVVVELLSDEKGIVWPESIAPFKVHLISLGGEESVGQAQELYQQFLEAGVSVLYDDRECGAGEKFNDADLLGIPYRIVVSEKSLSAGGVELKKRSDTDSKIVSPKEIMEKIQI